MKFLVLHGYGQNGTIFQRKHQGVERQLRQTFPDASFVYPSAPVRLRSDDRPEDAIDAGTLQKNEAEDVVQRCIEPRGWCHLYSARDTPYGLTQSLDLIADILTSQGPFDGIIAFSQGTYIAAMVLSLLEGESRYQAYLEAKQADPTVFEYPQSFRKIVHPPMKFGVLYSGFMAQQSQFAWLYDAPRIQTPILHYSGKYDPVLEDQWREAMHERVCDENGANVVVHPGAHHVPTNVKGMSTFIQMAIDIYAYVAPVVEEENVEEVKPEEVQVEEEKAEEECDSFNDSGVETDAYEYSRLFSTLRSRRRSATPRRQLHQEPGQCRRASHTSFPRCFDAALTPLTPIPKAPRNSIAESTPLTPAMKAPRNSIVESMMEDLQNMKLTVNLEINCPSAKMLNQLSCMPSEDVPFGPVVY